MTDANVADKALETGMVSQLVALCTSDVIGSVAILRHATDALCSLSRAEKIVLNLWNMV